MYAFGCVVGVGSTLASDLQISSPLVPLHGGACGQRRRPSRPRHARSRAPSRPQPVGSWAARAWGWHARAKRSGWTGSGAWSEALALAAQPTQATPAQRWRGCERKGPPVTIVQCLGCPLPQTPSNIARDSVYRGSWSNCCSSTQRSVAPTNMGCHRPMMQQKPNYSIATQQESRA